jgi:electron transport complex protein RnfB
MKGVIYFSIITLLLSIIIVVLNKLINKKNEKFEILLKLLPGINCGMCGFGSCEGMANELLKDKEAIYKCKVLKDKSKILEELKITGGNNEKGK